MATTTKVTIDHHEIRRWAQKRGARPTVVKGTGIIRFDFPGYSGEGKLQPADWNDFFRRFDESQLALIYQDRAAGGQRSNFNKLVGRETVDLESGETKKAPARRRRREVEQRGGRGPARAASRPRPAAKHGARTKQRSGQGSRTRRKSQRTRAS